MTREKLNLCLVLIFGAFLFSGCQRNRNYLAEKLLWKAEQKVRKITEKKAELNSEDYQQIISAYRQVIKKVPLEKPAAQAGFIIAGIYVKERKYHQAEEVLKRIIQNFSDQPLLASQAKFRIGKIYEIQNNWERAEEEYMKVVELYPLTPLGLKLPLYIARHYKSVNDEISQDKAYEIAIRNYQKLINEFSDTPPEAMLKNYLARAYLGKKETLQAIEIWKALVEKYPRTPFSAQALLSLAEVYLKKGELSKTIEAYQKFAQDFPDSQLAKNIKYRIGQVYFSLGQYDKARKAFSEFIPESKDQNLSAQAKLQIAFSYQRQADIEKAEKAYRDLKAEYPQSNQALAADFLLGSYLLGNEKYEEKSWFYLDRGISEYKKIIENSEEPPQRVLEAMKLLSLCYIKKKQWEEALSSLRRIVETHPQTFSALASLLDIATIYKNKLEKPVKAIEVYKEIIGRYPDKKRIVNFASSEIEKLKTFLKDSKDSLKKDKPQEKE